MNESKEVKIALVTVYDENLYKIINQMTGPAFFQAEQKLKQNYPKKIIFNRMENKTRASASCSKNKRNR